MERWRVETCLRRFRELSDKAFTSRLPGMRFGRRYRTQPFEQVLQRIFKDELLFGGEHDEPSSYFTKVAITATTDTGERPVIFTNYNREIEPQCKGTMNNTLNQADKCQQATILCDPTIQSMSLNCGKCT